MENKDNKVSATQAFFLYIFTTFSLISLPVFADTEKDLKLKCVSPSEKITFMNIFKIHIELKDLPDFIFSTDSDVSEPIELNLTDQNITIRKRGNSTSAIELQIENISGTIRKHQGWLTKKPFYSLKLNAIDENSNEVILFLNVNLSKRLSSKIIIKNDRPYYSMCKLNN